MTDAEYATFLLRSIPEAIPDRMIISAFRKMVQGRSRKFGFSPSWEMASLNLADAHGKKPEDFRKAAWGRALRDLTRIAKGLPPVEVD